MTPLGFNIIISAPALGFAVGHITNTRPRWVSYVTLMVAPIIMLTAVLIFFPSAPPGYWAWWSAAMVMTGPLIAVWGVLATIGFAAARWLLR